MVVATGRAARGLIALKDDLNDDAIKFLGDLKRNGIETLILTSQPKKMTNWITKNFAPDNVRTNLTPEGKAREVQIFRAKGKIVAVIGNDAHDLPALKNSDVSFLIKNEELRIGNEDITPDFEIPTLGSFLSIRETISKLAKTLKINRIIALFSWIILLPPSIMSALENPLIPWHPLASLAGVIIFSAIISANSLSRN